MFESTSSLSEQVKQWLGDVQPLWSSIGEDAIKKLLVSFPFTVERIIINENDIFEEIDDSLGMKAVRFILSEAMVSPGIKLTAKDNLNRNIVLEAINHLDWPMYRSEDIFKVCKVANEDDVLPLHFFHIVLKEAGLIRKYKGHLVATKKGKELFQAKNNSLFGLIYKTLYERIDISYFDRVYLQGWPNLQIGVVLYCSSLIGDEWIDEEKIMKMTAIPDTRFWQTPRDLPEFAFHTRILRPLWWFGLLEHRVRKDSDTKWEVEQFKKTKAFNDVFSFRIN